MKAFRSVLLGSSILMAGALAPLQSAFAVQSQLISNKSTLDVVVNADGTYTATDHEEDLARTAAAAKDAGQTSITYDELTEDEPQVTEAYTLKADGTRIPVDTSAIYTQAASADGDTVSSGKQKVIIFPKVATGDTVVYTVTLHEKIPIFHGFFEISDVYSRTTSYNDSIHSISVPGSMTLGVDAHEIGVETEERGNRVHYRWHFANPDALAKDEAAVSEMDRNPRVFASSFASWDDLGRAYAEMIPSALKVTPKLEVMADTITAGITDRRMQARKIYEWVSQNIRYVSVQLGVGGYMPHAAEDVLTNGYGDCKDHATLLAALLKAKGIESDLVMINRGKSYKLPEIPVLAFNHVINWLPEFNLYADTTDGVLPFGTLALEEYGKPVVHATRSGGALRRTPIVAPGEASVMVKTTSRLNSEGQLTGETSTVARGPFGVELRFDAEDVESKGDPDMGSDGNGTYDFASPAEPGAEYKMVGRFEFSRPEYLEGSSMTMYSMTPVSYIGDVLMGPLFNSKLKDSEPTVCYTGTAIEEASLELPEGKRIAKLPRDVTIADTHLRYSTQWKVDGQVISVRREFVSVIDKPLCSGEVRKSVAKDLARIRSAYRSENLSLVDNGAGT